MFTARIGLDASLAKSFQNALDAMSWDNPKHRPILEAEGLKKWLPPQTDGYASLRTAARAQGFFKKR
jgi:ABC-type phosphate/phosphonate transport system substrate-binding protein